MINQCSIDAVEGASFGRDFCRPLYESYCFSRIPGTIKKLLGLKSPSLPDSCTGTKLYDTVILFLVDAFGWKFFKNSLEKYPFLRRFKEKGIISKLTSQFPSTTAAHISCLNTGLEVGQHGIYEWFYYEPIFDRVIAPLLFSFAGDHEPNTLLKTGVPISSLCPYKTVYEQLGEANIPSTVLQHQTIAHSAYSEWVFRGSEGISYTDFPSGLKQLSSKLGKKGYFYVYFSDIDSAGHRHGCNSKEVDRAIDTCFHALEAFFTTALQGKNIAVIVAADHGMADIDPHTTFYLNQQIPSLESCIQRNKAGDLIAPAGSSRDFFLHAQPKAVKETVALLRSHLKEIASVYPTEELVEQKLFGAAPPSKTFLDRVGNIVILPHGNHSVWWYEKHHFEQRFHAMHGGLSRDEMETPFLFLTS